MRTGSWLRAARKSGAQCPVDSTSCFPSSTTPSTTSPTSPRPTAFTRPISILCGFCVRAVTRYCLNSCETCEEDKPETLAESGQSSRPVEGKRRGRKLAPMEEAELEENLAVANLISKGESRYRTDLPGAAASPCRPARTAGPRQPRRSPRTTPSLRRVQAGVEAGGGRGPGDQACRLQAVRQAGDGSARQRLCAVPRICR